MSETVKCPFCGAENQLPEGLYFMTCPFCMSRIDRTRNAEEYIKLALQAIELEHHPIQAVKYLDKIDKDDPRLSSIWYSTGVEFLEIGLNNDMKKCFNKALELSSPNEIKPLKQKIISKINFDMGLIARSIDHSLVKTHREEQAETALRYALSLDESSLATLHRLVAIYEPRVTRNREYTKKLKAIDKEFAQDLKSRRKNLRISKLFKFLSKLMVLITISMPICYIYFNADSIISNIRNTKFYFVIPIAIIIIIGIFSKKYFIKKSTQLYQDNLYKKIKINRQY